MLILVGVTINVAISEGLFGKTREAAMETEKHSVLEQMISAMVLNEGGYINVPGTYSAVVTMLQNQGMTVTPSSVDSNATSVIFEVQGKRGTYTYSLTSNGIDIVEKGITVSANPSSINVGGIATLNVTKTAISSETAVTYSSSDTSVATVSGTTVTGVVEGTVTITATCTEGGKTYTDTCEITVTNIQTTDDLIPTMAQKTAADFNSSDGTATYSYANETVCYMEASVGEDTLSIVMIVFPAAMPGEETVGYLWACNDATATFYGNAYIPGMQAKKWYYSTDGENYLIANTNCPINKSDYTQEQLRSEEYIDRVIASFSSTND